MPPTIAPPHPFDTATALTAREPGVLLGRTTAAYANMVGPFGGITAATLLRAVLDHPERIGDPVALTVNYAAPIADGEFEVRARPARTNRSTQHWTLKLGRDGEVSTTATAVFGVRKPGWSDAERTAPDVPPAESLPVQQFPEAIAWIHNYEMRFAEGGPEGMATGEPANSRTAVWVRDVPHRPLDFPALASLADIFLPRIMMRLGRMVPAGTVSLTVHFHADAEILAAQGDRPVLGVARASHFGGGYFDQSAELWGADGTLLATSHQMVYFKA
ncbi:acyl-CoA thioesterase [Nocardia puris]|uniref:Acyl-CoA thioesterase n=1 Tax=Nocardia puris TaxID=208602 RepID=A0A366DKS9_9NOCA|nr:thioesterase family protein [Nocardia puris]RBO90646.1 acyl-CoA thioesterase [Nocardia puris]